MPFEVIFSEKAAREYSKLPSPLQERIKEKLLPVKENPFHYFERLKGRVDYKLRVGDYRVIADINYSLHRIEVTKVGPRRNIYEEK